MTFNKFKENAKTNSVTITEERFVELSVEAIHSLPDEIAGNPAIFMTLAIFSAEISKMIFHTDDVEGENE